MGLPDLRGDDVPADAGDELWMRRALGLAARAARVGEVPVGAVLVRDGRVLGDGHNAPVSRSDPTAHAEILALRRAARAQRNYRLIGATLYSTVEPCLMCLGAALHARVGRIVFAACDPKVGGTVRLERLVDEGARLNHEFEVVGGVLAVEAAEMMRSFFEQRRAAAKPCGEVPKWS